jgi:putative SOS response-associated peptidase YedK
MPVILTKEQKNLWLSNDIPLKNLIELCNNPYPDYRMNGYRVSKAVNITKGGKNKEKELMEPEISK